MVTIRNWLKASFWHSSWIKGRPPASLWPMLYQHIRRKNRTVRDAILNGYWIRDIAHNLNHDLINEFLGCGQQSRWSALTWRTPTRTLLPGHLRTQENTWRDRHMLSSLQAKFCQIVVLWFGRPRRHWNASSSPGCYYKIGCGQLHACRHADGKIIISVLFV